MISFDKTYLDRLSTESGFIRDNLESVGATSKAEDVNLQFTAMPKIESANMPRFGLN